MKHSFLKILLALIAITAATPGEISAYNRHERDCRNYIVEGNKLYKAQRYADAEVQFQKALESDPTSIVAQYNLAATLIKLGKIEDLQDPKSTMSQAREKLEKVSQEVADNDVSRRIIKSACYNLGNMAFNLKDYAKSIEFYKKALRIDPNDDKARQNLRLAQLKLKEQQNNQNNNQDQKNDKDQDKNQDQNKDQENNKEEQKQDQQDQQNNQDKDQNQDKPQQPQQPQGGISDDNAAKILQTMENEEAKTRRRVMMQMGQQGGQQGQGGQRVPVKPW